MARRPPAVRLLAALVPLLAACVPAVPVSVASLEGSRQLVTVTFATQQTLRATAGARDTTLERVSDVAGWPTAVRGDTLHLQVARWRADGRVHAMEPADVVVAVRPDAGATVRPGDHTGAGFPLLVVGALVLIGLGIALTAWWGGGPFGG